MYFFRSSIPKFTIFYILIFFYARLLISLTSLPFLFPSLLWWKCQLSIIPLIFYFSLFNVNFEEYDSHAFSSEDSSSNILTFFSSSHFSFVYCFLNLGFFLKSFCENFFKVFAQKIFCTLHMFFTTISKVNSAHWDNQKRFDWFNRLIRFFKGFCISLSPKEN